MRVIVLAAGQGYQLDGFSKLLIRDPRDGRPVIERYLDAFAGMEVTVVLGHRAIEVMHRYPGLRYVLNGEWAVTNNSYSLALALDERPCYVLSSDLFFEPALVTALEAGPPDAVLTEVRDQRNHAALSCRVGATGAIEDIYQGALRDPEDPEAIGIYRVSDPARLRRWRSRCLERPNLFCGQNLPLDGDSPVLSLPVGAHRFDEVNTPLDYLRMLEGARAGEGGRS